MKQVVSRKIPLVKLIGVDELKDWELSYMSFRYQTKIEDFIICDSGLDTILVNKSLSYAEDIVPIIKKIMEQRYLNIRTEKLMDRFEKIAGENAGRVLYSIWYEWREKLKESELKRAGEDILCRAKENHISRYLRSRKNIIKTVFNIGFGLYSNGEPNYAKGAENAFMYGYLCCM